MGLERHFVFACSAVRPSNPHLSQMNDDNLYHLALDTRGYDLRAMFNDVKVLPTWGITVTYKLTYYSLLLLLSMCLLSVF